MKTSSFLPQIRKIIRVFDPNKENSYFIFGSAARRGKFHDIDLGVRGNRKVQKPLGKLEEMFYDSPIPYKIDVVDFDCADAEFRDYVMNNEAKVWI